MISYLKNPEIKSWEKIFCRPKLEEKKLSQIVEKIWDEVRLENDNALRELTKNCLLYTSPSPRDLSTSRMPSSA